LANIDIIERERLCDNAAAMGERLYRGLEDAFADHPNVGEIRGGKGLLAAVEFVDDRASKRNFAPGSKIAARLKAELLERRVVTRTRPAAGPHPAPGDILFFAPPLIVSGDETDQLVRAARESAKAVLGV
ncbi:MAG TPA: aminotransferase class III-fold pyridoxal phosphate-dependent enzyme, partial [Vicinamibacterales bacterium]|nr:aminotransferase class III-fold pyridoxal phosphate-dependent enzyme [Vicinamibacterales bacterium]